MGLLYIGSSNLDEFRGFGDLSPELQERIRRYIDELVDPNFSSTIFDQEAPELTTLGEVSATLPKIHHYIPGYRNNGNAVGAYYFLSSLFQSLHIIQDIEFSPEYVRFLAEWIGAANQSADFLAVQKKVPYIESVIEHHIDMITGGGDIFTSDLEISDDTIFIYRDKILNLIVNLAYYFAHIGNYTELTKYAKIGSRIATLFGSAQIKFDIIVLELGTLLTRGESKSSKLDYLIAQGKMGIQILEKIYSEEKYQHLDERNKNHLAVLELFLRIKRSDLSQISEIRNLFQERDKLIELRGIEDPMRQRLIHIEIILYIAFKELYKNTTLVHDLIQERDSDFEYVNARCADIDKNGLHLEEYLEKPNARLFLAPLIELFKYNVREINSYKNPGSKLDHAMKLMIEVYRIAVGVGNISEQRQIFKNLSFFDSFIKKARSLLVNSGNLHISDDEILDLIESEIQKQERSARGDYESLLHSIQEKWKGTLQIASINIAQIVDGVEYDPVQVIDSARHRITHMHVLDEVFQGKKYQITIILNQKPIQDQEKFRFNQDMIQLLPYIRKMIIEKKLNEAFKKLNHDFVNLIPKLHGFSGLIASTVLKAKTNAQKLIESGNAGPEILQIESDLARALTWLKMLSDNLCEASGYAARVRAEITGIVNDDNSLDFQKSPTPVLELMQNKAQSDQFSDSLITLFNETSVNISIMMNVDYFLVLFRNIRQNAERYKRPEQDKGILQITVKETPQEYHIMFKDMGIGMDQNTISAYQGKSEYTTPSTHKDSQRVGSQEVMDVIERHGWKLMISSNPNHSTINPSFTAMIISISKK